MYSQDILTDTTNRMNSVSNNGIKDLWNNRLRSYRGSSADPAPSRSSAPSTPKRSSSVGAIYGGNSSARTPSTDRRSTMGGGLTDSNPRSAVSAATPGRATQGSAAAATPRGRLAAESSLKRRSASVSAAKAAPASPVHRRQRSVSPLAKPLFNSPTLLMPIGPQEPAPVMTLVLDLDETLVSNRSGFSSRAILRPYCMHVLHALRHVEGLEIVLWTASTKTTALPVVEQLHAFGPIFDDVIFRNDMWFTEGVHTKDLRLLGRDLDRTLIVDNAPGCCKLNPSNAILIEDFHGSRHEEDAALVNVYYAVLAIRELVMGGTNARAALADVAAAREVCHAVNIELPEAWRSFPLSQIPPLKIPPCGTFFRANTPPPCRTVMKHWKL